MHHNTYKGYHIMKELEIIGEGARILLLLPDSKLSSNLVKVKRGKVCWWAIFPDNENLFLDVRLNNYGDVRSTTMRGESVKINSLTGECHLKFMPPATSFNRPSADIPL